MDLRNSEGADYGLTLHVSVSVSRVWKIKSAVQTTSTTEISVCRKNGVQSFNIFLGTLLSSNQNHFPLEINSQKLSWEQKHDLNVFLDSSMFDFNMFSITEIH